jgi:hypothetical protein
MHDFHSVTAMTIDNTLEVISESWAKAHNEMREFISEYTPSADEEFITRLFHAMFSKALRSASESKLIEMAFLEDLRSSFWAIDSYYLSRIAQGLIADVTLHDRKTEGVTGGDLGLMISRPLVSEEIGCLRIGDYRCGILCQAKMKRANGSWGKFTKRQREILPNRHKYLALLLYSYEDLERRSFLPFRWQLCDSATFEQMQSWLKTGVFPSLLNSTQIIHGVGKGAMGTDDDRVLDEVITPKRNPALTITIDWPDGESPGSQVFVSSKQELEHENHIFLRR